MYVYINNDQEARYEFLIIPELWLLKIKKDNFVKFVSIKSTFPLSISRHNHFYYWNWLNIQQVKQFVIQMYICICEQAVFKHGNEKVNASDAA